jgi:heptosyltransferase-2
VKRILVIGPSWIGDTVLAQPLFKRLHERFPGLMLDVLAPKWTLPLLERMPQVHSTIVNPFAHGEFNLIGRFRLARSLAKKKYDQAIVLPNSWKSALVPFFARIPVRTGFVGEKRYIVLNDARKLDESALPTMAERFAQLGENRGIRPKRPLAHPRLHVDDERSRSARQDLTVFVESPVAVLCPGAEYGPAKRWPARYFGELAKKLNRSGYDVWLVGSPRDTAIGEEIVAASDSSCQNLCGKTDLGMAIDLIACASLVVTNDSGLMHIAAALDKPMIAIYGSSTPAFTPPLSEKAKVVKLDIECSPCFQRECPLGHFNCMMQLTPETVLQQLPT